MAAGRVGNHNVAAWPRKSHAAAVRPRVNVVALPSEVGIRQNVAEPIDDKLSCRLG